MHIELRNVTKRYGAVRALEDVSAEILPGQIIAVLGENGAGKTTLLRVLAGVAGVDSGEVMYDGERFGRESLAQRVRIRFIPDFPPLFPQHTVLRNVGIVMQLYGADKSGTEERVLSLFEDFSMLPLANAPAHVLSRGQAYKTALIGLIAADPELWLLDEPLASGMDPVGIAAFRKHAREAAQRGRTLLFSTQWLDAVERIADRVALILRGQLRSLETVESIQQQAQGGESAVATLFQRFQDEKS